MRRGENRRNITINEKKKTEVEGEEQVREQ